jgi:formate hydrogenlyase subunit 3/multisubunit Na+/H+ antiporter MnhD subunit
MDALMILALAAPLLLALLVIWPASRRLAERLAPLAPLPALLLALAARDGLVADLPWLLLGSRFMLDETGRLFLGFTAVVWLLAGWYARGYLAEDPRRHVFWSFYLATAAGNLGVCLAGDAASFYLLFALMTFAAYGLVVHSGSAEARRAGRVYLIMAVLGEGALVAGMLLAVHAASSHYLSDLVTVAPPAAAIPLLLLGFGIKVGMPLLHMWLPLAHPVAPVPASAVLSGVMLKAGLLGWLRFLPLGAAALPEAGTLLLTAGLLAMFLGVAAGLCQREPKVLLAYSSISQMGFMTLGVGAGLLAPQLWPVLLPAVGLYALHHALAKSALFLGVGVIQTGAARRWVLAGMALPALALAGAPLSSGLLVKAALKAGLAGLPAPWDSLLPMLLPLAALGTALLMARLLFLLLGRAQTQKGSGMAVPWGVLVVLGALLPWVQPSADIATWPSALWPILLAVAISALVARNVKRAPALPPGDILLIAEHVLRYLRRFLIITARKHTGQSHES